MILVFEKQGHCPQCDATKTYLNAEQVDYSLHTIEEVQLDFAQKMGFSSAPIVVSIDPYSGEYEAHAGHNTGKLDRMIRIERE